MAWPLIIVGAALMAGSGIGASQEENGDILNLGYPDASTEEQLASKNMLDLATKLYEDSNGSDPEFYKQVFEGLPENKMSAEDRQRLAKKYDEINILANQKAIAQAGQAFGENMDELVARGVMSPAQADKQKLQNEAKVRAMMSVLNKRWQATEISDARKMWVGDQRSGAQGVGVLANVRAKNQVMFNQVVDSGLRNSLKRAGAIQDFQSSQMWANEQVLQEARAAEYQFWGNMLMPGKMGQGGSTWQMPAGAKASPGTGTSGGYMDSYGSGMYNSSFGGGYQYTVPDSYGSYAGSGYYSGGGYGGYMG
jgi:hypothetical protein